ncbi:hypothetical protein JANAI62_18690 [Jannaschia pagri]|uniref:Ca2+-binding protein, RTX toxin-related n=1 Tax=Jannaschia pagri TaxID=2829797 RepID=A0ABQ4NLG2_9RHOB|nr:MULTISPECIES: calcium-binding protein [unclassified Jannaschia]GIT91412.1 hypothetical protein JANAI61_18700 [Jannaschia sp. AI_61]GIT95246.1 hypothetical protein JANAI62_18690 [Jannaschia sp. AI_62]
MDLNTDVNFDPGQSLVTDGTLISLEVRQLSGFRQAEGEIVFRDGIRVSDFVSAINAFSGGNPAPLRGIFAGPITFDGSGENGSVVDSEIFSILSGPATVIGSDVGDELLGTLGNDSIVPGSGFDFVVATPGSDTIDFALPEGQRPQDNGVILVYQVLPGGASFLVDGVANTGSIVTAEGTDTLLNVASALDFNGRGFGLLGTPFNDRFVYTGGPDSDALIAPGPGNDTISVTISGDNNYLLLSFDALLPTPLQSGISVNLDTGVVARDGYGARDQITITGDVSQSFIDIGATSFADSLVGRADGEELISPLGGNDTIDGGGEAFDIVRYNASRMDRGLFADLSDPQAAVVRGSYDGTAFTDSLRNIDGLWGTREFNDTLIGSAGRNEFRGLGGNDDLRGEGGTDVLLGGDGRDTLRGGDGDDRLRGESGDDLLLSGNGSDRLEGGDGDDILEAASGFNSLDGGEGSDTLRSRDGNNELFGGASDDVLESQSGNDTLSGGDNNDRIRIIDPGLDMIVDGGLGRDIVTINQDGGRVAIFMEETVLTDFRLPAQTILMSSVEDLTVDAGDGFLELRGSDADNFVQAGRGADELRGRGGDDTLLGGAGKDTLAGGVGDDSLVGEQGEDRMDGGLGDDTYVVDHVDDLVLEGEGNGVDQVISTVDVDLRQAEIESVILRADGDLQVTGNRYATDITGNSSSNILIGGGGEDTLTGGDGRDYFVFQADDAAGPTRITDFSADDFLVFDDQIFGLGAEGVTVRRVTAQQVENALTFGAFRYDTTTGELSIDRDGAPGPRSSAVVAVIEGGGPLDGDDILLF